MHLPNSAFLLLLAAAHVKGAPSEEERGLLDLFRGEDSDDAVDSYEFLAFSAGLDNNPRGPDRVERLARRDRVVKALKESSADVVCMSGVWYHTDINEITEAVQEEYPHTDSFIHGDKKKKKTRNMCKAKGKKTQIDEFVDCVEEFCSVDTDWDDDDRRICPLKFCNPFQTGMDHECFECAMRSCMSVRGNRTGLRECMNKNLEDGLCDTKSKKNKKADDRTTHGLVLLSKHAIVGRSQKAVVYPTEMGTYCNTGLLQAEIEGIGHVACTEMCPDTNPDFFFDYTSGATTWLGVNDWEAYRTLHVMCDGWQDEQDFFLIGNLNSGPHVPNVCPKVEPKFPSVFNLFLESGLRSALLDSENKQCTTCDDNPFVDPASGYVNTMTSHILLKRSSNKVVESAQVLYGTLNREAPPVTDHPLSEHYAVSAVISGFAAPSRWRLFEGVKDWLGWEWDEDALKRADRSAASHSA